MHPVLETHAGMILSEFERNGRDDSDFCIEYWDAHEGRLHTTQYATTRGPFSDRNSPTLKADALPSVRYAAAEYVSRFNRTRCAERILKSFHRGECFVGDLVEVYKGRKVPKGTIGRVMTLTEKVDHISKFGTWQTTNTYAFIKTQTGYWTVNTDHCKVIERGSVLQQLFDYAS